MDGNNSGRIIIPSPLRKRGFIHHGGQDFQIIKFLKVEGKSTMDEDENDDEDGGLIYRVRDIRTNDVVNITLPLTIQHEEEKEEDNYFQILEINEDRKEVTLKSWLTGAEKTIKVWLDEDVNLVKDGLMEIDSELFCTLKEVLGKEVIGDFKFLPKDSPIMKMPDVVMGIIFSKLTPEDRLSCRLVTPGWATLLPITKFVKCSKLSIDQELNESHPITAEFHRLDIPNHPIVEYDVRDREGEGLHDKPQIPMKDLQALIDSSLLENVDYLSMCINAKSRMIHHILTTVSHHCRKLTEFSFHDEAEETEAAGYNWFWAKQIIARNIQHLKGLSVVTSLRLVDSSSDGKIAIAECTSLQDVKLHLDLSPTPTHAVLKNLESVPSSIVELSFGGMATFTKSQLLWVTSTFPHLKYAGFNVHHNHSDNINNNNVDEDEVDGNTILQMLNTLSSLQHLSLQLGSPIQGRTGGCRKAIYLTDQGLRGRFRRSLLLPRANNPIGGFETLEFQRKRGA